VESGDSSPHSKRKPTKKDCLGDKIANFADGFVLLIFLIDVGQAVLAFGLFGGGNRGFSKPYPPLKRGKGTLSGGKVRALRCGDAQLRNISQ